MSSVFMAVLNMSATSAFVIAALCVARLALQKLRAPKWVSYALWAVAGFRLAVPFTVESALSLLPRQIPEITLPGNFIYDGKPVEAGTIAGISGRYVESGYSYAVVHNFKDIVAWVWFAGMAAMLLYAAISYARLVRRKDGVSTPFVYGFAKPKIHMPGGLEGEGLRYATLHEQTHIKRRDHLVKLFAYALLCVHWFNPLVWVAFTLLCADMEMSCDERVLRELGMGAKAGYSQTLLSLSMNRRMLGASPLSFGEGGVKGRVKNVLGFKKPTWAIMIAAVALLAVVSVGLAVNRAGDRTVGDIIKGGGPRFRGVVEEIYEKAILVRVDEGGGIFNPSDLIHVSLASAEPGGNSGYGVGDKVCVYFNGFVEETDPARVGAYAVVLEEAAETGVEARRASEEVDAPEVSKEIEALEVNAKAPKASEEAEAPEASEETERATDGRRQMTLADLRGISQTFGGDLTLNDLSGFAGWVVGRGEAGVLTMHFDVDGGTGEPMPLYVSAISPDVPVISASLRRGYNDGFEIDIRYNDVDAFMAGEIKLIPRNAIPMSPAPPLHWMFSSAWAELEDLPAGYGKEQAAMDGVYVDVPGGEIINLSALANFYAAIDKGVPEAAFVRTMSYTVEGDPIITDYQFDGEKYIVAVDATRDKFGAQAIERMAFKYLVKYAPPAGGGYLGGGPLRVFSGKPAITDEDWARGGYFALPPLPIATQ